MPIERHYDQPLSLLEVQKKIMDYLARRNHSEAELYLKLAPLSTPDVIEQAMSWARTQNWLPNQDQIQEDVITSMTRRKKGQHAINQKLEKLGLAPVQIDLNQEYEKALAATQAKWDADAFTGANSHKESFRILRFLAGRGFSSDIAQKVLKNYFNFYFTEDTHDEEF